MFVKMHRIITQKTCHLFSATVSQWLRVSQLIIRERADLSESQNEPLWCEEISLTVFGWAVFTLLCGGVGTLYQSVVGWSNVDTLTAVPGRVRSEETFDVTSGAATGIFFSNDKTSCEIMNVLFCSAGFCHMISRGCASNFQGSKVQSVLHSSLKVWELGQANIYSAMW